MDLPVQDIRSTMSNGVDLKSWLMEKICKVTAAYYGFDPRLLRPRTWKEVRRRKERSEVVEGRKGGRALLFI